MGATSFSRILRNCNTSSRIDQIKRAHTQILVKGLTPDVTLQTDLLLAYSRCGRLRDTRHVFDEMTVRSMHSWNILISTYVQNSFFSDAITLFGKFLNSGLRPDHYTLPVLFKACAGNGDFWLGMNLHSWVIRLGFEDYVILGSSILDFYVKCGDLFGAEVIFANMPWKDSVVWNTIISGLGKAGLFLKALNCFRDMVEEGQKIDDRTISGILSACGGEGDLMKGKEIHGQILKSLVFDYDVVIGNSLIDMYARCGYLRGSEYAFKNMRELNLVTWTTMISCYGLHGRGEEALTLFKRMISMGLKPNCVTLTAILAGCSHSGLIEDGRKIFDSMRSEYGLVPSLEHYACMVDLLGRCGDIEEAFELIKGMDVAATASIWGALLAACMMHKNVEIGVIAAHQLFALEPRNSSNYVCLSTIYDSLGMRDGVSRIRAKMKELRLVKNPGCSWIIVSGRVYRFYQGDFSHPLTQEIWETLHWLTEAVMLPVSDEYKF